jgi:hypothetical protein
VLQIKAKEEETKQTKVRIKRKTEQNKIRRLAGKLFQTSFMGNEQKRLRISCSNFFLLEV